MPTKKSRTAAKKSPVAHKGNGSKPANNGRNGHKRTEKLFTDIEQLATQTPADCNDKPRKRGKRNGNNRPRLCPLPPSRHSPRVRRC